MPPDFGGGSPSLCINRFCLLACTVQTVVCGQMVRPPPPTNSDPANSLSP